MRAGREPRKSLSDSPAWSLVDLISDYNSPPSRTLGLEQHNETANVKQCLDKLTPCFPNNYAPVSASAQLCGLGLDVSASRRSRLDLISDSAIYVCPRPIFGQIVEATLIKTSQFWELQECFTFTAAYAIVTIARYINTLKQWTWKSTSRPVIAINKTCTVL